MTASTPTEVIKSLPEPTAVRCDDSTLHVDLADGRSVSVPLTWFPRLLHGTPKERANTELGHNGIHWPDLNEDIPVEGLFNGERSGESLKSVRRWLDLCAKGKKEVIPHYPLPHSLK